MESQVNQRIKTIENEEKKSAVVTEINGKRAKVQVLRHAACKKCGGCLSAYTNKSHEVWAENPLQASVGDYVTLALPENSLLKASLIAYGLPLLALIVGLLGGILLQLREAFSLLLGLFLMGTTFMGIRKMDGQISNSQKYTPTITAIL